MVLPKSFFFLAVSCITAASTISASPAFVSASSLDKILHSGNGNYIIQLNHTTCIKDFVPRFIDSALEVFTQSVGLAIFEKKNGNRIVRRGTDDDQVHVFDAYDFGTKFKAITVKFEELAIVKSLLSFFGDEILSIIPDRDIKFDLPTPQKKNKSLKSRFYRRAEQDKPAGVRVGNFDYDRYEHDENCPLHSQNHKKRAVTAKNKKTNVKTFKSTKKTTKRKTATKKKATKSTKATKTPKKGSIITKKSSTTVNPGVQKNANYVQQTDVSSYGLTRISQHRLDLSKPYIYDSTAGSGSYVYVVDDGLNVNHVDFEGRAKWGYSAYNGISRYGEGHGTHVAGTIGSKTYGVAKKTNLIAVQVLNEQGNGAISSLLAGLQWVLNDAKKYQGKAIINISLGLQIGGSNTYQSFSDALDDVVKAGVPIFAAAGNWNTDTCQILPAGNKNVFAIGATDKRDVMTTYSGYGSCVDILAPGTDITSTYITSTTSNAVMTGTSMSTPHVAGVAALLIGNLNSPTPANLYAQITSLATRGAVSSIKSSSPNLLLFNGQQLNSN